MDIRLTVKDVWFSTIVCGILGLSLLGLLLWLTRTGSLQPGGRPLLLASGLFWGLLAILAFRLGWEVYYQYLYPAWMRRLAPLDLVLYALIGLGLWSLAMRMPGKPLSWFIFFGAVEGVLEHILGIYGMHILEKVPWLKGLPALPLLVFSFFEYSLYWGLTATLALILGRFIP